MQEEHHAPALLGAEYLEGRPQDMRLRLNTPQMNRLKYLLSRDIGRYVDAKQFPEVYDGREPYLVVDDDVATDPVRGVVMVAGKPRRVLRSAGQQELDEVLDLKAQLDNLWHGGAGVTGDYRHRNIESVTSAGQVCEECGEEEHETDLCPHLFDAPDFDPDAGFGYTWGEDHQPSRRRGHPKPSLIDPDYPDGVYIQEGYAGE